MEEDNNYNALHAPFCIATYNCRGFNQFKEEFVRRILSECSILCLQEHWLAEQQLPSLSAVSNDFLCNGICGFDDSCILAGRPYGGCAVFWRSDIEARVEIIDTGSRRIAAIKLRYTSYDLLIINVYMPYEKDAAATDAFIDQLFSIETIINSHPGSHVIVCGDFNVDFSRVRYHTDLLNDFCDRLSLAPTVRHCNNAVDYTYNFDMQRFNVLDHFLLSSSLFDNVVARAFVDHDADNLSDHDPVFLELSMSSPVIAVNDQVYSTRPAWCKASHSELERYRAVLTANLDNVIVPTEALLCRDVLCKNASHIRDINTYANQIIGACTAATAACIPATCMRDRNRVPGWTELVEPARQQSCFWHRLWVDCGRPHSGTVADIMRRTRATYHRAVKNVKHNEQDIIRQRFAEAALKSDNRDFWNEVRKLNGNRGSLANVVDNKCNAKDIAALFAEKYSDLYCSVSYSATEMAEIERVLTERVERDGYNLEYVIHPHEVADAVSRLKLNKRDGYNGIFTNNFKYANYDLYVHVANLLSSITVHGSAPDDFLIGTLIPIPKGRCVNVTDSGNYRGITLSSVLGRILDIIILNRYASLLVTSDLQFGFKRKRSTAMCTMVMKEVISHYMSQDSSVFCTFLDASKAFDKVHYCKLFSLLLSRHIPAPVLRLLLNIYTGQYVRVLWNGIYSCNFSVRNGVKQGGIISPILFSVYFDDVLCRLQRADVGCHIGKLFAGALAYADDLVLLAPTASAMRRMLAICVDYAAEYQVSFNADKTKCLMFAPKRRYARYAVPAAVFQLGDKVIGNSATWPHLGHIMTSDLSDHSDIVRRRGNFIGQVNNLLCQFSALHPSMINRLFNSFCCSHYGCELWDLQSASIDDFCVAWRTALRRVWRLPRNSHSRFVPLIADCLPLFDCFCRRTVKFIASCFHSDSPLVRDIVRYGILTARTASVVGRNMHFCALRYGVTIETLMAELDSADYAQQAYIQLTPDDVARANCASELISVRDGALSLNGFSQADAANMIALLLTE